MAATCGASELVLCNQDADSLLLDLACMLYIPGSVHSGLTITTRSPILSTTRQRYLINRNPHSGTVTSLVLNLLAAVTPHGNQGPIANLQAFSDNTSGVYTNGPT